MKFSLKLFILALSIASIQISSAKTDGKVRKADYPIDTQFIKRQSKYNLSRTLTNDQMKAQLMNLFEAARWSASCFNNQPWRFIYALHGTKEWDTLTSLISTGNQNWVKNAGALILVLSSNKYERNGKYAPTHTLDTGLAVSQLILQASNNGLVAHPMEVHDYEKTRKIFGLGKEYTVEAMIAVGEESASSSNDLAARDIQASSRKAINEFAFEGTFPESIRSQPSQKKSQVVSKGKSEKNCCE